MLGTCTRYIKIVSRKFLKKHEMTYFIVCLVMVFLLQNACSFLPYIGKALVYPAVFQSQEMKGRIVSKLRDPVRIGGRHHHTVYVCYFRMDGQGIIQVFPSVYNSYEEGDDFTYVQYSLFDVVKRECMEYRFLWGIAGVLVIGGLGYLCVILIWVIKEEQDGINGLRKMPVLPEYEHMSDKELYKLCQQYEIRVPAKEKKKREYLRQCLRHYNARAEKNNRKVERKSNKAKKDPVDYAIMGVTIALIVALDISLIRDMYYMFCSWF